MAVPGLAKDSRYYRWCFVPQCRNTTISTPNKVFVIVPQDVRRRKSWLHAAKRDDSGCRLSLTSSLFCCEDHFNMEEDMENYMRFKMIGGNLRSKKEAIPRFFACQPSRTKVTKPTVARRAFEKRLNAGIVAEALATSEVLEEEFSLVHAPEPDLEPSPVEQEPSPVEQEPVIKVRDIGVQVRPSFRSKATMCTSALLGPRMGCSSTQTSPMKRIADENHSPNQMASFPSVKRSRLRVEDVYTDSSSAESAIEDSDVSDCNQLISEQSEDEFADIVEEEVVRKEVLQNTRFMCKKHPKIYLGVPEDSFSIVKLLADRIKYKGNVLQGEDVVMLVLRKIRLNESFVVLGHNFGVTHSHVSHLFSKFTPIISKYLKQLVYWPKSDSICRLIPSTFQARYNNVQSIIDCFEIEVEKPTKALNQALTWSDYKKCNTLKYLVSATPDGVINFISKGYGGRVSDMNLLNDSGYLDKLPEGIEVMADRGFKHVAQSVRSKKCTLVRPPSVSTDGKMDAAECRETKKIASLRIHIERLIRRIREFKLLEPHACIDIHMLGKIIDDSVFIVAGLVNLQGALIK